MQRLILWGSVAGLASCLLKPQFVTITPDYGYVDGCIDVLLAGARLGESATAKIGDSELPIEPVAEDSTVEDYAQDVGFEYTGQVGPAPGPGWYDVTMTVDGEDLVLKNGFYFRTCPSTFVVDHFTGPADPANLVAGDKFQVDGCNLDSTVSIELIPTVPDSTARRAPPRPTPPAVTSSSLAPPPPTGDTGGGTTPTGDTGGTVTDGTDATTPTGDTGTTGGSGTGGSGGSGTAPCECAGTAVASLALSPTCSTARAEVDVPTTLAAGSYCVRVTAPDGTSYSPLDPNATTYSYYYGCPLYTVTVGGAK